MASNILINSKPQQLAKKLTRKIEHGELKRGQPLSSIRELMKKTNLSKGTVIKGLDLLTKEGLIERHPSRGFFVVGSPEASNNVGQITFLTLALSRDIEPYIQGFREGMKLRGEDFLVSMFSCNSNSKEYPELINKIIDLNPAGIVACAVPEEVVHVDYEKLQSCNVPIVLFGLGWRQLQVNRIIISPEDVGRRLARRVLEKGYKKPAILNSYPYPEYGRRMMREAFIQELDRNGVSVSEKNIMVVQGAMGYSEFPNPHIDAERTISKAIADGFECDVLVADHDYPAIGAMRAMIKAGYSIPNDIAVLSGGECSVGYGDLPKLTTIKSPHRKQGELAAQLMFDSLDMPSRHYGVHYLSVELVEGQSG